VLEKKRVLRMVARSQEAKSITRCVAVVLAICALAIDSRACIADSVPDVGTVQGLFELCTAEVSGRRIACDGYVSGVEETMIMLGATEDSSAQRKYFGMCPTDVVSPGAAVQAFKNWTEKHPEMWSKPRFLGVGMALREAWPCS
jgi:Rap1a immunity proteins